MIRNGLEIDFEISQNNYNLVESISDSKLLPGIENLINYFNK